MDAERMQERVAAFSGRRRAVLHGYRLDFNKVAQRSLMEGYANIMQDDAGIVEGVLYSVNQGAIELLDRCEGYPTHYDRIQIPVITEDGSIVNATVYVAQPQKLGIGLTPSREYIAHLLAGADLLSLSYIKTLENWQTID